MYLKLRSRHQDIVVYLELPLRHQDIVVYLKLPSRDQDIVVYLKLPSSDQDIVAYLKSCRRRRANILDQKTHCSRYRCVPKIASPEARKKEY